MHEYCGNICSHKATAHGNSARLTKCIVICKKGEEEAQRQKLFIFITPKQNDNILTFSLCVHLLHIFCVAVLLFSRRNK
jgi:hypothetical protein